MRWQVLEDCWDFDDTGQRPPGIKPCVEQRHYSSKESFGRDIVAELIAAARKEGIHPGLYFSHADWYHSAKCCSRPVAFPIHRLSWWSRYDPNLRLDPINPLVQGHVKPGCVGAPCAPQLYNRTTDPERWRRGVLRHRAQLLEVLTKYGE